MMMQASWLTEAAVCEPAAAAAVTEDRGNALIGKIMAGRGALESLDGQQA